MRFLRDPPWQRRNVPCLRPKLTVDRGSKFAAAQMILSRVVVVIAVNLSDDPDPREAPGRMAAGSGADSSGDDFDDLGLSSKLPYSRL